MTSNFNQIDVRTAVKATCISTIGVKLWNSLSASQIHFHSNFLFNLSGKSHIIDRHKGELHL